VREILPNIREQQTENSKQQPDCQTGGFSIFDPKGFTLIELLVVSAIIIILLVIALASYRTFGHQTDVDTSAQRILNTLQLARNQTVASEEETVYGVHFEPSKYVLFKGAAYDPISADNKEYTLDRVELSVSLNGGGGEVVFDRVRGTTSQYGYITVQLIDEPTRTKTIIINPLGQVSLEETVNPTGARIADTRHLYFDLGWSIQNSTTLRFVFGDPLNPSKIEDIAMASGFISGTFYWEGKISVNGSDQILKVHSHFLDGSNTILCIHRDRRYNNEAVQILIDGKEIVSYTAAGTATVGAFGGVMTQQ